VRRTDKKLGKPSILNADHHDSTPCKNAVDLSQGLELAHFLGVVGKGETHPFEQSTHQDNVEDPTAERQTERAGLCEAGRAAGGRWLPPGRPRDVRPRVSTPAAEAPSADSAQVSPPVAHPRSRMVLPSNSPAVRRRNEATCRPRSIPSSHSRSVMCWRSSAPCRSRNHASHCVHEALGNAGCTQPAALITPEGSWWRPSAAFLTLGDVSHTGGNLDATRPAGGSADGWPCRPRPPISRAMALSCST